MSGSLEEERDSLIRAISELYAHGEYTEAAMETLASRTANAGSLEELGVIAKNLPTTTATSDLALTSSLILGSDQELAAMSGVLKKTGKWLHSRTVKLDGTSSAIRLDFTEYAGLSGALIRLELDARSSAIRIVLPSSFEFVDELGGNQASAVKVKGKPGTERPRNKLILGGRIRSSSIKIVLKR